jgi:hypothetical protein
VDHLRAKTLRNMPTNLAASNFVFTPEMLSSLKSVTVLMVQLLISNRVLVELKILFQILYSALSATVLDMSSRTAVMLDDVSLLSLRLCPLKIIPD